MPSRENIEFRRATRRGDAPARKRRVAMQSVGGLLLLASLVAARPARADATLRYKSDFKSAMPLPAQQNPQAQQIFPSDSVIQIKGDKSYSKTGRIESLQDFTKQEITLIDPAKMLFVTVSMKDYLGEAGASLPSTAAIPPQAMAILQTMKTNFSSKKTGRTDVVLGVQVEENEWTLTLVLPTEGLPLPPGAFPAGQPLTLMKIVARAWTAQPEELTRVPALAEVASHISSSMYLMNPNAGILQAFANFPGIREGLAPLVDQFAKNPSAMLKLHFEIYVPVLAQLAPLMQARGQKLPAGFDPNAALGEVNIEATELSSAPIDDSVFRVPAGYQPTPLADFMKALRPAPPAPPRALNPPPNP